jgi:hypothetical protein
MDREVLPLPLQIRYFKNSYCSRFSFFVKTVVDRLPFIAFDKDQTSDVFQDSTLAPSTFQTKRLREIGFPSCGILGWLMPMRKRCAIIWKIKDEETMTFQ